MSDIRPFEITVSDAAIADLYARLDATRWPDPETPDDWSQGIPLEYTRALADYWRNGYDMKRLEAR